MTVPAGSDNLIARSVTATHLDTNRLTPGLHGKPRIENPHLEYRDRIMPRGVR